MKSLVKIIGVFLVTLMLSSCVVATNEGRRLPPGQAKKVYGGSARYYAPGQVKKRVYYYDYDKKQGHKKHKGKHRGKH